MKRNILALVLCFVMLAAVDAMAGVPEGAMQYKSLQRMRGGVMPLDDGGYIVYGRGQRPVHRQAWEADGPKPEDDYDEVTDGLLARLDGKGNALWEIRMSDNEAQNDMYAWGVLPDGRLLALFRPQRIDGPGMGEQFFVVDMENGHVDEMLPSAVLSEMGRLSALTVLPDGYLMGGREEWIPVYGEDYDPYKETRGREVRRLDKDCRVLWTQDVGRFSGEEAYESLNKGGGEVLAHGGYAARPYFSSMLLSDGNVLLYGSEDGLLAEGGSVPGVLKLDGKTGETLWRFDEVADMEPVGRLLYAFEEKDGILLLGQVDEPKDGELPLRMTMLDMDGTHLWTKAIDGQGGVFATGMQRLAGGFALAVRDEEMQTLKVLHISADGEVTRTVDVLADEGKDGTFSRRIEMNASPDGKRVVLSGSLFEGEGEDVFFDRAKTVWFMEVE